MAGRAAWMVPVAGLLLGACTVTPVHQPPLEGAPRSFIRFETVGGSVGRVQRVDGDEACTAPRERKPILYTKAWNPLIPNVNLDGTWIRAGERISLYALSMSMESDAQYRFHKMCWTLSSFTPRAGATYLMRLDFNQQPNDCRATISELAPNPGPVADLTRHTCPHWGNGDNSNPLR